jgi:hypothetical protein
MKKCNIKVLKGVYNMKKAAFLIVLFAFLTAVLFAQVPSNWDTNISRDTAELKYNVGISQPCYTEQEAVKNAWQNAVEQFASSIAVRYEGRSDITLQSQNYASYIEDAFVVTVQTSSFSTNIPITGVRELARKTARQDGKFVTSVLAAMIVEDYNKAKQYIENEEASFLAYRFFNQRGLFTAASGKPAGYDDYYSWLRNNCVIISINDANATALLEQIDLFLKKLYKNAALFAQIINGQSARIIYNSAKYYDGTLRALQNTNLFAIQRESSHLILRPSRANILTELRNAVASVKDSSKFVITGLEIIQTQDGDTANSGTIVINQFKTIASRQFNMQAVNFNIPSQYLSGYVDENGIIRYVQNNSGGFPARYLIICRSETKLDKGILEYKIPPLVNASCHFTLYDIVTGETMQSNSIESNPGAYVVSNLSDQAVTVESRRALQSLSDPKTRPGLENIMGDVLGEL